MFLFCQCTGPRRPFRGGKKTGDVLSTQDDGWGDVDSGRVIYTSGRSPVDEAASPPADMDSLIMERLGDTEVY